VAAAFMALAALACCLPLGFAGALGVLALSEMFDKLQPWFLGAAGVLLAVGIFQAYRGQKSCQRRASRFSLVVLALSAATVLAVLLFPQHLAVLLADYVL